MAQALYRKWRPRLWDEVIAQEPVVQTLRNAVRTNRVSHAYLLSGPRGTGKTTTARLLAKALNCLEEDPANRPCDQCEHCLALNEGRFLDLIEIDAASNTSVDDVRALRDKINFSPSQGRYKVYIIDEVHMLSTAAFNALLKTLEEPPPHAIFILATTEVHKIPATVLSRVQRHEFKRIPVEAIVKYLQEKAASEGLEVDEDALTLIARQATGAMRDAISLLDQLSSIGGRVTLAEAQEVLGTATNALVLSLVDAVLAKDPAKGLEVIQAGLDSGTDARQFARQVVDYLRNVLLVKAGSGKMVDATQELRVHMAQHARQFNQAQLLAAIKLFNAAATDTRSAWHPGLGLELALAEVVEQEAQPLSPPVEDQAANQGKPAAPRVEDQLAQDAKPARTREVAAVNRDVPPEPEFPDLPGETLPPPGRDTARSALPQGLAGSKSTPPSKQAPSAAENPGSNQAAPAARNTAPQATPAQTAASQSTPSSGRVVTQADIMQNWNRIRQMVQKENKLSGAALNSCVSKVLKDNILVLGFQTEVVKSKMQTDENIDLLRKTIQAILGANLGIRCVVVGSKGSGQHPDDLDGDGMVNAALDLGAKIMHEE